MKILILHTEYQHKGGEDTVVQQERTLLEQEHEVQTMIFRNHDGLKGALQFLCSIWNVNAAHKVKRHIRQFKPDVVHLHNWHFAMGPLVIRAIAGERVPIVVTLHNYRLLCPSALLLHNGSVFRDSVQAAFPWKAIRNKVYRNSYLQTFWLAFVHWWHRRVGTWHLVAQYIVLSEFGKSLFCTSSLHLPLSKFTVKANFVAEPVTPAASRASFFLFVGRLSVEKGIHVLLKAFTGKPEQLFIAGEGPLQQTVLDACGESPNIRYLGKRNKEEVQELMASAAMFILPSICYEGMPVTIIEAFSTGTPVITSNMGAMSVMIGHEKNGFHFDPGSAESLYEQVKRWSALTINRQQAMNAAAKTSYYEHYTPEKNLNQLVSIYQSITKPSETETFKYQHDRW